MNAYEYIVNKYEIDVGRQYIVEIKNMAGSLALAELFAELNFNLGAEIGVAEGLYSEVLCQANPKLHLYSVDSWESAAYESGQTAVNPDQKHFDTTQKVAKKRLAPYDCTIIKKTSMEALSDFEDNSLDFVYIDANHDFVNFINDLHHWTKKVRVGGIVSGHDFVDFTFNYRKQHHVKPALIAYARSCPMIPLFVIMTDEKNMKLARDKYHSWFWVKK